MTFVAYLKQRSANEDLARYEGNEEYPTRSDADYWEEQAEYEVAHRSISSCEFAYWHFDPPTYY